MTAEHAAATEAAAFTEFERAGWSRTYDAYHRFFEPITGRAVEPVLDAAQVGPGSRVLDVATGPGYVAGRAAARGAQVIGVDLAEPFVELAGRLHPGVEFRLGDANDLPFAAGTFTAVVANFLMPHLADHARALAEMARVTGPGGTVALSTWDVPDRVPLIGVFFAAIAEAGAIPPADLPPAPSFFAFSADDALTELMNGAGLDDVRIEVLPPFTHRVDSTDALWDGVLGASVRAMPVIAAQPPSIRRRIREEYERLVARFAVDGGGLDLPVSMKIASGRRR